MKKGSIGGNLWFDACTRRPEEQEEYETMKSRAELLAEIEENRLESKEIEGDLNGFSIVESDALDGYNPYDHPGQRKEIPDAADITARRRESFLRHR